MEYFRILNLEKEPFSNSPEPEFFYQSEKHLGCLQKLELSIRLRRGLNVVIGDVGTGKTTLCRQLILKCTNTEEDSRKMETHLLLDPSFTKPLEFLTSLAVSFGIHKPRASRTEWQIKENIKNYLFMRGVDEEKTVILIIDEGQKLPDFCLEILREFLNYETNEMKLLQIVIFAQKEFEDYLREHANFADRINQYYLLEPLNFIETRSMIRYRLVKASGESGSAPAIFTFAGLYAAYLSTGGYPRRIINLCHQVVLTLIIQNRTRAGWFLVRSCAMRVQPYQSSHAETKKIRWAASYASLALIAVMLLIGLVVHYQIPSGLFSSDNRQKAINAIPVKTASVSASTTITESHKSERTLPGTLGSLTMRKGASVFAMIKRVYGDFDPDGMQAVKDANPNLTNNWQVQPGDAINIPAIPSMNNPLLSGKKKYFVKVHKAKTLEDAYTLTLDHPNNLPPVRIFSYWNSREGTVFLVIMKNGYESEDEASRAIKRLPAEYAENAEIIKSWDNDTRYFAKH
jgi:general secretion pathway protein A